MTNKQDFILNSNSTVVGRFVLVMIMVGIVVGAAHASYAIAAFGPDDSRTMSDIIGTATGVFFLILPFVPLIMMIGSWLLIVVPVYYIVTGEFYPLSDPNVQSRSFSAWGLSFTSDIGLVLRFVFLYCFGDWRKQHLDSTGNNTESDPDYIIAYKRLEEELHGNG